MDAATAIRLPDPGTAPEDLIREARRRQRRRHLTMGAAVVAAAGAVAALIVGSPAGGRTGPPGHRHRQAAPAPARRPGLAQASGPILAGADTTVLMWEVQYPALMDDLSTGRRSTRQIPAIATGDEAPYVITAGRWLVYPGAVGITVNDSRIMAISPDLRGKPRVLGATGFFAPAADSGRVWLERYRGPYVGGFLGWAPVRAQSVPVAGLGRPGPVITLPAGAVGLVEGTDAGLLLQFHNGRLALWNPGAPPVDLAYSGPLATGLADTARTIAYGTGCSWHETGPDTPNADVGYQTCPVLRVLNVATGGLASFPAPAGTHGWVPDGFNHVEAISPDDQMIAAYAAVGATRRGRVRLYVLRLSGVPAPASAVPASATFLLPVTAWSVKDSWLLYQGPGERLWAHQVTTGKTRGSTTPCCRYTAIVAIGPVGRGRA